MEPQMKATTRTALGAVSDPAPATQAIQSNVELVKKDVEEKLGRTFSVYQATQFCTQTVNGYKYFVKVDVGNSEFIHLELYKPINGQLSLLIVEDKKSESDPLKK
ncbi:cystatin-A2-like [Antedon mediterranea]|uniref:cystatin-A2-like n=1 Tax=Antedon mediterranea TaxID=105859 RepID=UPI003AF978BC